MVRKFKLFNLSDGCPIKTVKFITVFLIIYVILTNCKKMWKPVDKHKTVYDSHLEILSLTGNHG